MENFFFEKFFQKSFYGDGRISVLLYTSYFGGIMYNGNETSVTNYDMEKGRENNET